MYIVLFLYCCVTNASELTIDQIKKRLNDIEINLKAVKGNSYIYDSVKQQKNRDKFDQLFKEIGNDTVVKMQNMQFAKITPFFRSNVSAVRDITHNKIKKLLLSTDAKFYSQQINCFDFLIENSDEDYGLLLLEVCSITRKYDKQLGKNLKRIFLKNKILPFLLEFNPSLFNDTDIIAVLKQSNKQLKLFQFQNFLKSRKFLDGETICEMANLILSARHGDEDAFEKFDKYAKSLEPIRPRALNGYAIIASPKSYEILFEKQNDFRKYSYSGLPVAHTVTGILHKTIEDFPHIRMRWLTKELYLTPNTVQKYSDWIEKNKTSYKLQKLTPYELYSLLSIRMIK